MEIYSDEYLKLSVNNQLVVLYNMIGKLAIASLVWDSTDWRPNEENLTRTEPNLVEVAIGQQQLQIVKVDCGT